MKFTFSLVFTTEIIKWIDLWFLNVDYEIKYPYCNFINEEWVKLETEGKVVREWYRGNKKGRKKKEKQKKRKGSSKKKS